MKKALQYILNLFQTKILQTIKQSIMFFKSIMKLFLKQQQNVPLQRPDIIPSQNFNNRRRKYQTVIQAPQQNFFQIISSKDNVYFWIVANKQIKQNSQQYKKLQKAYSSCKDISIFNKKLPICKNFDQLKKWTTDTYPTPCQIIIYENIFTQVWEHRKQLPNLAGLHVISYNDQIAKIARQQQIIKNIYQDQEYVFSVLQKNVQKIAMAYEKKHNQQNSLVIKNAIFPNFIKLSKYQKSQHSQYRLHLIGLRKLKQQQKMASKDKFIQFSRKRFPEDISFINQYQNNLFEQYRQVLRFYTLDCFFYKSINNTLRMAKSTQEFFSIGQPFNKIFDAIKNLYQRKQITVYRGADLTKSQSEYLQQNIGKYIQISGFISTSKNFQTSKDFAKKRRNNTIFQIHLKQVDLKHSQYDYGFVDLQANQSSAYQNQDEILINALNIFKIQGKSQKDGFIIYKLSYGIIFDIMDQNDSQLDQNDRFAYFAFKQIKQTNQQVNDIGQVYLRTFQPEKAVKVYQNQKKKIYESLIPVTQEQKNQITLKVADAYLANGQPQKALKQYESLFIDNNKKKPTLKQSYINKSSNLINQKLEQSILKTDAKISNVYNIIDRYQDAQIKFQKASSIIQKNIGENWSFEVFWVGIGLIQQQAEAKNTQFLYQQSFLLMKDLQKKLDNVLKKTQNQKNNIHQVKKIYFKLTETYEKMSQIAQKLEKQKNKILHNLLKSFDEKSSKLSTFIQQNSLQKGLIGIRRSQIVKRSPKFNEKQQLQNISTSLNLIKNNSSQNNQILAHVYSNIADTKKKIRSNKDYSQAKQFYKKQLKVQTIIYGSDDSRSIVTKIQIANCQKEDKFIQKSLKTFDDAYNTKLYKTEQKYVPHAKVLFNMAQAYLELGNNGLSFKSYQKAYQILQTRLSPKDFDKSVLRFKIKIKIGRLYLTLSPRIDDNLQKAKNLLLQSHQFMIQLYHKQSHSDIAQSYNSLGYLYSVLKDYSKSRDNFQQAIITFKKIIVGQNYVNNLKKSEQQTKSVDIGKIKVNLALCYAQMYKKTKENKFYNKSVQSLKQAQEVFNNLYTNFKKPNPFLYQSQFINAQISIIFEQYEEGIKACEKSVQLQRQYRIDKKMLGRNINYELNQFIINKKESVIRKNQSIISQQSYLSLNQTSSQHSLKCLLRIGQCYISMKNYTQAKQHLQRLENQIAQTLTLHSQIPLFNDNSNNVKYKDSKKKTYLIKISSYLKEINNRLNSKTYKNITQAI